MTSVGGESPGSAEETFKAVLVSAMAGCRAMAIIADDDAVASKVTSAVGSRMEGAGALVMTAIAQPGATLQDLIDQAAPPAPRKRKDRNGKDRNGKDKANVPDGPAALALRLLQGEDAGLLTVAQAHLLDATILESLLSLSRIELEDNRVLQVLLSGNAVLNTKLDRRAEGAQQVGVLRWFLDSEPQAAASGPSRPVEPSRPTPRVAAPSAIRKPSPAETSRLLPSRLLRRVGAVAFLFIAAASAGWFIAGLFQTETTVAAVEEPAAPSPTPIQAPAIQAPASQTPAIQTPTSERPAPTADLLISTDHGPRPTMRSGETVVVRLETTADKFVYCYYMDGFGQVSRIFPNRFQSDAFIPAGQAVEIPPGPERPFNIRLDTPGRIEFVACLASPTEVDSSRIAGAEAGDLTSIPGLQLHDLLHDFAVLSTTGARGQTMPISVVAGTDSPPSNPGR
jgi:hypothetical protein